MPILFDAEKIKFAKDRKGLLILTPLEETSQEQKIRQVTKAGVILKNMKKMSPLEIQEVRLKQINLQKSKQSTIALQRTNMQKLKQLQRLELAQAQASQMRQAQRPVQEQVNILETKPTKIKLPIPKIPSSQLQRIARKAEEGGIFEAIGFKGGKEVSLGFGTKREVTSKLSKFLSGTLSASGFLRKGK